MLSAYVAPVDLETVQTIPGKVTETEQLQHHYQHKVSRQVYENHIKIYAYLKELVINAVNYFYMA